MSPTKNDAEWSVTSDGGGDETVNELLVAAINAHGAVLLTTKDHGELHGIVLAFSCCEPCAKNMEKRLRVVVARFDRKRCLR